MENKLKLHLGCGSNLREGYINIDIQRPYDVQHDFRRPLPYENGSVDEIVSNDVIQHFSREEWKFIKKDWVRVLKSGGKINLLCWDFEWVLKEFLANQDDPYAMQRIYAGQGNDYDYFKNGFTWNKLRKDLSDEKIGNFSEDRSDISFINLIGYKV